MANAIYAQILQTVQSNVAAIDGIPTVRLRKSLRAWKVDGAPVCLVCPGLGGEKIVKQAFAKTVVWSYPVLVVLIQPGNMLEESTLIAHMNLRETVRNTLFQVGAVGEAYDLEIEPQAVAQLAAELSSQYEVTGFQVSYRVTESRVN